jgi:hypothetical protein
MRGVDQQQGGMFSYLSAEERVRQDHPLRSIRTAVDGVLEELSPLFHEMYSVTGRPSIPPEKLECVCTAEKQASGLETARPRPPAPSESQKKERLPVLNSVFSILLVLVHTSFVPQRCHWIERGGASCGYITGDERDRCE